MDNSEQAHWYCLASLPKKEHIAAANIRSRIGIEAFCPRIAYQKKTKRGVVRFVEPMFPNYLFVYCNIQEHMRHLLSMQGVRAIVKYGGDIPYLPKAFIDELTKHFPEDIREVANPELNIGETVVVTEGPFKDLLAIVHAYTPANDRIKVMLDFLGRDLEIEVSTDEVIRKNFTPKTTI